MRTFTPFIVLALCVSLASPAIAIDAFGEGTKSFAKSDLDVIASVEALVLAIGPGIVIMTTGQTQTLPDSWKIGEWEDTQPQED